MNYNLENEKNSHPYKYYGKVFEEEHDGNIYLFKSALQFMIDDMDQGMIEESHYEECGYYELTNFILNNNVDTLDLTFMRKNDIFDLDFNQQIPNIKTMIVNLDNLECSYIPLSLQLDKLIVVKTKDSSNMFASLKSFMSFIEKYRDIIEKIELKGFTGVEAFAYNLAINAFKPSKDKEETKRLIKEINK